MTAPSFRVLNETLNTRVKKNLEREKEKRPSRESFFLFQQKARKRKKGKRVALFFIFFLSSVSFRVHVLLSVQIYLRAEEQQKRRDFETTEREE